MYPPCAGRSRKFGTALESQFRTILNHYAMKAPIDLYRRLKLQAKRLLLAGEVDRYMDTLRRLHELRRSGGAAMA